MYNCTPTPELYTHACVFSTNCNCQVVCLIHECKNKEKHRLLAWKASCMYHIARWWLGGFKSIHWANNSSNVCPYVLHKVQYNLLSNHKRFACYFVLQENFSHGTNVFEYIIELIEISDKRTNQTMSNIQPSCIDIFTQVLVLSQFAVKAQPVRFLNHYDLAYVHASVMLYLDICCFKLLKLSLYQLQKLIQSVVIYFQEKSSYCIIIGDELQLVLPFVRSS